MSNRNNLLAVVASGWFCALAAFASLAMLPEADAQPAGRSCSSTYTTGSGVRVMACANEYDFGLWFYNDTDRTITLQVDECRFSWNNGWTHNQTAGNFTLRPGSRTYQTLFVDDGLFAPGNAPTWRCNFDEQVR
jgi:hypothetical protein